MPNLDSPEDEPENEHDEQKRDEIENNRSVCRNNI